MCHDMSRLKSHRLSGDDFSSQEIQVWHRQHPYPHALWDSDQQYILKLDALSWKRSKVLEVFLVSQESMFREAESEVEKPG